MKVIVNLFSLLFIFTFSNQVSAIEPEDLLGMYEGKTDSLFFPDTCYVEVSYGEGEDSDVYVTAYRDDEEEDGIWGRISMNEETSDDYKRLRNSPGEVSFEQIDSRTLMGRRLTLWHEGTSLRRVAIDIRLFMLTEEITCQNLKRVSNSSLTSLRNQPSQE